MSDEEKVDILLDSVDKLIEDHLQIMPYMLILANIPTKDENR